ncbi:CG10738 [Drosophila busckii]|uniref:Guanylate cyclase n=1 Tax=Drosophila busckii TaxID=30019 RepID=A0A0M3QWJ4_DROBS|nr:guanylate cyclase 32E [Drosophila busckii]XP_033149491.1 guanylate cyclase 32E [Drosophila busckii]ALC44253.1 CG10738 [Drosophila busckii]
MQLLQFVAARIQRQERSHQAIGLLLLLLLNQTALGHAEVFTLGYLTGSQRRPGNLDYQRPGITISGAISLAVEQVNAGRLGALGHSLQFVVAETYGDEVASIRQTAALWTQQVAAYIGPQETCVHEGRMAAAFNLPMISYYCTHREPSNKLDFPTFARTRPPDTQISKSVVALLLAFNWTQVSFLYLDDASSQYQPVAETILSTLATAGVTVRDIRSWNTIYHHGYKDNPFDALVEQTFANTRIYLVLGHYYEHVGLMLSLQQRGLLSHGEYFVVGIDIEQYEPAQPEKYLRGLLKEEVEPLAVQAFQSYVGILPTAPVSFATFAHEVNRYMERPPFNFPNPLGLYGGTKQISAEAAYLYDAIHVYANALLSVLERGERAKNGSAIVAAIKGSRYLSAMGYHVYIDENGDAAGNYTVLARGIVRNNRNQTVVGLIPTGTFSHKLNNRSSSDALPDLHLYRDIDWVGGQRPAAAPRCGFSGEKCVNYTGEISAGIAGGALLLLGLVSLVFYRNWRYEQELDSLLWKIDFREVQMHENEREQQSQKQTRSTHPLIRTSQVSLSSNPDADFRYTTIFTPIGLYKGQLYAIKKVRKKSVDITREMKKELKLLRDARHDNVCAFIGACTDPPNICIISEYCTRGSLKDILENEDVKLDNMFIASMVADIIRGVIYLHESPIRFHGSLCTSNCLVDSRWVVKLTDFGLFAFKQGIEDNSTDMQHMSAKCLKLLYRAPELLRQGPSSLVMGTQRGDAYSFGILLYEMHVRRGPFGETGLTPMQCLQRVMQPQDLQHPYRPSLQPLQTAFDCVSECLRECWSERAEDRPEFKSIRAKLRPLRKGMRPNIFDNMMAMMEKYANNLEALVDDRTDQLQEEKKKTDALLHEMLPRCVADQLKKGHKVDPEHYEAVSIYFSDIVGFTAMSAESTPLQVVDFLNDLYTCFDSIIGHYDVYKVETIGDAYMVVSGLPLRNGDLHAAEIATMSLHLLSAVSEFKIRHRPTNRLLLRIGIHSGPVCAGVVGLKMPRYCLFGDTVNTASRMESSGVPLKIHCSWQCRQLLERLGGYHCQERGVISMKGKGEQRTYWLMGEDEEARVRRTYERSQRRGSRALNKFIQGTIKQAQELANDCGIRSSLKQKHLPRNSLTRSSSLESPKKLRFAAGSLLEHHRYHSDEALLEVDSYTGLRRSSGGSTHSRYEESTLTSQSIEQITMLQNKRRPSSYPTANTPLLLNHVEV